ncbi:MAG: cation-translocating P-type ATPase [Eubacterium sp.]|nr:cation-translocating P-type ATPase [Eubacterium sp.]
MNKKTGLTTREAEKRLNEDGENRLSENKKSGALSVFAGQFKDTMVMILLAATAVSAALGEWLDALIIIIIVVLNAALGFIQEYRAEKTLEALKKIAAPSADVYRDGRLITIPASKLVRGDVIAFKAGAKIPADCRITEAMALECDEAMLTGESIPVNKYAGKNKSNELNQKTVCYMGTVVIKGHGLGEVINTGLTTQMGLVSGLLTNIKEEKTPLQNRLAGLSKVIGASCIIICVLVSIAGILRGFAPFDMLLTGISLAVAAIPEGLPATVTISLALAVRRIYKQNAIVNKLHSVETLGCTNVICTDKTGTITQNKMNVTSIYINNKFESPESETKSKEDQMLFLCAALCNNATRKTGNTYSGDPTETALLSAADKYGINSEGYVRTFEVPFDSSARYMSVTVKNSAGVSTEFLKGAVDVIMTKCGRVMINDNLAVLNIQRRMEILGAAEDMAAKALRTLGFAYKVGGEYVFIGIVGLSDPIRPEARSAVIKCKKAGVRVIMLTGDHKVTACEIARQAGIINSVNNKPNTSVNASGSAAHFVRHYSNFNENDHTEQKSTALTGDELSRMSDNKLSEALKTISVFARVSPSDKLRIVRALKAKGATVAMTGDGVNDAPAVKEAAIGVAMGITGTDVTKEAAQIILLDDNFATLVSTIEQGRTIYDNIRKFIRYMLSCNIGEVITMFVSMALGMPVVLIPIQILLINLVTDGLPAIALSMEPPTDGIMSRPPRKSNESVFAGGIAAKIIIRGLVIGFSTLLSFMLVFNDQGFEAGRTAAFGTLALSQLIFVFECKDDTRGIFNAAYLKNPKLILAVIFSLTIVFLLTCTGLLSKIFSTTPLNANNLLIVLGLSFVLPALSGIVKLFKAARKKTI